MRNKTKLVKINRGKVFGAICEYPIEQVAGHLDLEGICYLKLVRTGPHELFVADATSDVLKKDMTYEEIEKTFWRQPAMQKWAKGRVNL